MHGIDGKMKQTGKYQTGKRLWPVLLVWLLLCVPAGRVQAAGSALQDQINLASDAGSAVSSTWNSADGMYLYYGAYGQQPVRYRMIAQQSQTQQTGCSGVLLDADTTVFSWPFNYWIVGDDTINEWPGSLLQAILTKWYKNSINGTGDTLFSQAEAAAIAETSLLGPMVSWMDDEGRATLVDLASTDHVFVLSGYEAATIYNNEDRIKQGCINAWWLRSSNLGDYRYSGYVYPNGMIFNGNVNAGLGVCPAFNLDLSSVLFLSESGSGVKSAELSSGAVQSSSGRTWKATVKDSSKTVRLDVSRRVEILEDGTVEIPYVYSDSGTQNPVNQISVMITDLAYTESGARILYYGALQNITDASGEPATGTGSLVMPENLPEGYHMYLLAECVSGDQYSDYASEPYEIEVGYDHTFEKAEAVAASCLASGNIDYWYCTKCGRKYSDAEGSDEITGSVILEKLEHTWSDEWVIDREATTDAEGSKHKVCLDCGETGETAVIEKLPAPETEKQTEKTTEEPSEKQTEEPTETVTTEQSEEPTEKSTEKTTEKTTEKETETETAAKTPGTGDNTPIVFLIALLLWSGAIFVTAGIFKMTRRNVW